MMGLLVRLAVVASLSACCAVLLFSMTGCAGGEFAIRFSSISDTDTRLQLKQSPQRIAPQPVRY